MRLLSRIKHAVEARWGSAPREQATARATLRSLSRMHDTDALPLLDLAAPDPGHPEEAGLLAHFRTRRMPPLLFQQSDRREVSRLVENHHPDSYKETIRRADLACRHVVAVLGSGETDLGDPINWWSDFKGGTWAYDDYEELNATLYGSDFQGERYIGDIKLPWELNKHAHFLELAKAYWLTADERYAEALLVQMDDWIERNPFLMGVAWTQNLIVAQRAIVWTLALQAVWQSPALTPRRLLRVLRSLYQHARYIPVHFEFSDRASNHLFGNAAGLAALALGFPEFREAAGWRMAALGIIESELAKQVYPDGVQYEQSVNYHRYVVEFCILPWLLWGDGQCPYTEPSRRILQRMLEYLHAMTQPTGLVQPISDADGARVWQFNYRSINDHRGLLNLGAVLLEDAHLKFGMEENSEDVLWWLGPVGYRRWEALPSAEPSNSAAFPEGGYFILRESWRPDALWAFFDCGHIGMGDWPDGVSVGTHGHSDILTFGLAAGGETLLTDIGSYTYTGSKPWHDYFRSACGHNVILVDGQDQSLLTTHWALKERARPRDVQWHFSEDRDFVTGAHDGYRRLPNPVLHRRSLLFLRHERRLIIRDDLEGTGLHTFEALFHAMPTAEFFRTGCPDSWKILGRRAVVTVTFHARGFHEDSHLPVAYRVVRGETNPIDGWYADDYGMKEPASVLHVAFQGSCPLRLYSIFEGGDRAPACADWHAAEAEWEKARPDFRSAFGGAK